MQVGPVAGKNLSCLVRSKLHPGNLSFSPSVVLRTPCADYIGVPRGALVGCGNDARRIAMVFVRKPCVPLVR